MRWLQRGGVGLAWRQGELDSHSGEARPAASSLIAQVVSGPCIRGAKVCLCWQSPPTGSGPCICGCCCAAGYNAKPANVELVLAAFCYGLTQQGFLTV